jgi:hypothetical protein
MLVHHQTKTQTKKKVWFASSLFVLFFSLKMAVELDYFALVVGE